MFKKGHHHNKAQVTLMETRKKPIEVKAEKPQNRAGELSPTTTLMHRGTLGECGVFGGRGMSEGPKTKENKVAQNGKTHLELWRPEPEYGC